MTINKYINDYLSDISNKKIIITGANSGLGFECAKICSSLGARVVLACRSEARANDAIKAILNENSNAKLEYVHFDQSTFESCEKSINSILEKHSDFYALFFNAGIFHPSDNELNPNGFPKTISTNAINIDFMISKLDRYLAGANDERRIIFQGSLAGRMAPKNKNILDNNLSYFKQYCLSKFALASLFNNYVKNNTNHNVKYMMCEPGITNSNIIRNFPKFIRTIGSGFLKLFMMKTKKACLSGMKCIAGDNVKSGDVYAPRGLFRISGYPKLYKLKAKHASDKIVEEIRKLNYAK